MSEGATPAGSDQTTLFDRTICLVLKRTTFGRTRTVRGAATQVAAEAVEASPAMVSLTKRLIVAHEYKAITSRDNDFDEWIGTIRLPSLLRSGTHAIPIPFVERAEDEVQAYAAQRRGLALALAQVWDRIVAEAEEKLGPQVFDPRNYPRADQVADRFQVEWNWIDYGASNRLQKISLAIFQQEREKAAQQLQHVEEEAKQLLLARMLGVVEHVVDRLTPKDDGKKKTLHKSLLSNVQEFLDVFPTLNEALGGNPEAETLVAQAMGLIDGVDVALLKKDDLVKRKVAEGFAAIRKALEASVVPRGTRQIIFDEDEQTAKDAWAEAHAAFESVEH